MPLIPVTTKPVASPVASQSFPPAPAGMNIALPANEIQDTEAVYLQDILLDRPGLARRRGPMTGVPSIAALSRPAMGAALTIDPQGDLLFGVLTSTGSNGYFSIYNQAMSSVTDIAWPYVLSQAPYPVVDAGSALNAGTLIGTASSYGSNAPQEALAYWGGGTAANYSTGTITLTKGSTTVTGSGTSFSGNVTPGTWLFANTDDPYTNAYIGMVQSVTNSTTLVLTSPSPYAATGKAYTLQALRGVYPKVGAGTLTGASGATTLTGGGTKFLKQGLNTGSWNLYRASDMAWIGKVLSVQSDIGLTLAAGAAISVADDGYVALRADGDYTLPITQSTQKPGFVTAVYSERQWYANNGGQSPTTYRLWFSATSDPEILDMTQDGNWIPINSTGDVQEPIVGLGSAYNSLVVLKETEAFGVFGTDPTTFQTTKLADDGTLSGMSVQQYGGGVIWAGRQGVHFYDGTQVNDLTTAKFGTYWRKTMETFDPTTHRMWSMVERNHYILYIENLQPPIAVVKGNTASTPDHWVVVINIETGAVTLWQNVKFRGAVRLPAVKGEESWFVYNDGTKGILSEASAFFDTEGNDPTVEGVANAGPDFYFESKKFDGGNPNLLKRFTFFILWYLIQGDSMSIDTVLGLNDFGSTAATVFPATVPTWSTISQSISTWTGLKNQFATWGDIISSVFVPDRLRFLKKSQLLAFRLFETTSNATRVEIGNYELGWKPMRAGRI